MGRFLNIKSRNVHSMLEVVWDTVLRADYYGAYSCLPPTQALQLAEAYQLSETYRAYKQVVKDGISLQIQHRSQERPDRGETVTYHLTSYHVVFLCHIYWCKGIPLLHARQHEPQKVLDFYSLIVMVGSTF